MIKTLDGKRYKLVYSSEDSVSAILLSMYSVSENKNTTNKSPLEVFSQSVKRQINQFKQSKRQRNEQPY